MVVVGAGSIAVGDRELPTGERRQFNIVVIDQNSNSITVHVRAMSSGGVFIGSHRDDFGGNTFIKLELPTSPSRSIPPTPTQRLDEAMTAITTKQYSKALELLPEIKSSHSHEKRQIEIKALKGLGRQEELIELLDPPLSADEVVMVISMLLDKSRFDEAVARLNTASELVDPVLFKDLTDIITARRMTL